MIVPRASFVLGRQASFRVSAAVVAHTLWTSACPAMTYRLYAQEWHLSHTVTTGIFAVYPIVVVVVLIVCGDVSDHIGRRATMLMGVAASLVGALLFAIAPDVTWLFVGRAFMGIGVGLTAGPSTAALVEFGGHDASKRAAVFTAAAQGVGFAGALVVGGLLTEYAPWPTRLNFLVLAVLLAGLLVPMWFLPRRTAGPAAGRWHPRLPQVPKATRPAFLVASIATATAYTHGVIVLSLGGQVAHDLVGSSNAFVNGAVLALFAIVSALVGVLARPLSPRLALMAGAICSALAMGLVSLAVAWHGLPVFLLAMVLAGSGYSLLFLGALEVIAMAAPSHHRGGVLSAVYLLGYLSVGSVAFLLGLVATAKGLGFAVDLGAATIAVSSLLTLVVAATARTSVFRV